MNLILLGLRGSGKSTVGHLIAQRTGWAVVDLDDRTAAMLDSVSPGDAWRTHGEARFREAEAMCLSQVLDASDQVVALGGGTPTAPGVAALLNRVRADGRGRTIYLWGSGSELRARLAVTDMSARPSLTGADPLAEIEAVLSRRDELFRSLADAVIVTDGCSAEEVATLVLATVPRP